MDRERPADKDFNPRSHKGSDDIEILRQEEEKLISIHAPTKGATIATAYMDKTKMISIHAPTKGATMFRGGVLRSREYISIHAPTKGATCCTLI